MPDPAVKEIVDWMYSLVRNELPEPSHGFDHCDDVQVEVRDGVKLTTRVFFPDGDGPFPVILVRNPYSPVNSDLHMQQPILVLIKYGFVIVYQQVRGTFESEGEWLPFMNERLDGLDTVEWIIRQPWMDGNIGTFGGSYLGHVQWCMADSLPPEVKTMYFSIYGGDPYLGYYKNGMFKFGGWAFWAMEMMHPSRRLDVDPIAVRETSIERFRSILPVKPHFSVDEQLFNHPSGWYRDWISHPYPDDDYWMKGYWGKYQSVVEGVTIPVMFQTGWFDFFFDSMVDTYLKLPDATRNQSRFVISPWHHGNTTGGSLDYQNDNILGTALVKDALEWFDHFLKGKPYPHQLGVVDAYVIGEGKWETWQRWIQPSGVKKFYLSGSHVHPDGSGELVPQPLLNISTLSYTYDPEDPVTTRGGNLLINYPQLEQAVVDTSVAQDPPGKRQDILSFVSEPLSEGIRISGNIKANFIVSSDADDTAFTVKVMEVFQNGDAYNIQDGITTLVMRNVSKPEKYDPGNFVDIVIELPPVLWTVRPGSKIRVDISSSNYPAYHIHPNIAGVWSKIQETRPAHQIICVGGPYQSFIEIPYS